MPRKTSGAMPGYAPELAGGSSDCGRGGADGSGKSKEAAASKDTIAVGEPWSLHISRRVAVALSMSCARERAPASAVPYGNLFLSLKALNSDLWVRIRNDFGTDSASWLGG